MIKHIVYGIALALIAMAIVFSVVTDELRHGCQRGSDNSSALVRGLRSDINGNLAIASDPRQSAATRGARSSEVQEQQDVIATLDSHIDSAYAHWRYRSSGRIDTTDSALVKADGFKCSTAFPSIF